jgi:hypothetical protein
MPATPKNTTPRPAVITPSTTATINSNNKQFVSMA